MVPGSTVPSHLWTVNGAHWSHLLIIPGSYILWASDSFLRFLVQCADAKSTQKSEGSRVGGHICPSPILISEAMAGLTNCLDPCCRDDELHRRAFPLRTFSLSAQGVLCFPLDVPCHFCSSSQDMVQKNCLE